MARKRMIDPRIWESEQVQGLTESQFKLFIYLISSADDEGRFKANAKMIASHAFPMNEAYGSRECENDLREISDDGLIQLYDLEGKRYGCHPNWKVFQTIKKPQPSTVPPPSLSEHPDSQPEPPDEPVESSRTSGEPVENQWGTGDESVPDNRREEKRSKGKGTSASDKALARPDPPDLIGFVTRDGTQPERPSRLKDPLADAFEASFWAVHGPWAAYGKERAACTKLASYVRQRSPDDPEDYARRLCDAFMVKRSTSSERYWRDQPPTPSALLANAERVSQQLDVFQREMEAANALPEGIFG